MCESADDGSEQDVGNSQNKKAESRASSADLVDADNAVTSLSKINTNEIVDQVSPREGFQGGGWICADKIAPEISVLQSSSSKNDDNLAVAQSPNDYLTMGGGFCLDEDDPNMDSGGLASPKRATSDSDLPNRSSSFDDRICPSNPRQSSNNPTEITDRSQQVESRGRMDTCHIKSNADGSSDVAPNEPVRSLRAMPNLRKKRRKS